MRQSVLGQMVTSSPCQRCGGLGEVIATPCPTCRGEGRVTADKTYQVDVPAGVDTGSTLRLTGRGAAGPRGGRSGDLYVHLRVAPHDRYERDGDDLVTEVPVSIAQAALGTRVTLTTLDGDEELIVQAGTQPGREFVLRGRGVHRLQGRGRGDLRAIVRVDVPTKLTARGDDPAAHVRRRARRGGRRERAGPVLAHQVGLLVNDELRRSAAHILVADVESPELTDDAAHHVLRVLRVGEREPVTVTDGHGRWRTCHIADATFRAIGDVVAVATRPRPVARSRSPSPSRTGPSGSSRRRPSSASIGSCSCMPSAPSCGGTAIGRNGTAPASPPWQPRR